MRTFLTLLLLSAALLADRVITKNDAIFEGKVSEDGDWYVIEMKVGTIRVRKDEVLRIVKTDTPTTDPKAKDEGASFDSKKEGFSFQVKRPGWKVLGVPPLPLVGAAASNEDIQVEIDVATLEDKEPSAPLAEESAKSLTPIVERLLHVQCAECQTLTLSKVPVGQGEGFQFRAEGKRKATKTDIVLRCTVLKAAGRVCLILYTGPLGSPPEAEAAFEELVGSFHVASKDEVAKDSLSAAALAFCVRQPEGWKLDGREEAGHGTAMASLTSPDGAVSVRLEARMGETEPDLKKALDAECSAIGAQVAAFAKGEERFEPIENHLSRWMPYTFHVAGAQKGGCLLVTREGKRLFLLDGRGPDLKSAADGMVTVLRAIEVYSTEATVDESGAALQALAAMQDADLEWSHSEYRRAQMQYRKVLKLHPHFAYASVMLAKCALMLEETEESIKAAEDAWKMLPRREGFAETVGRARVGHARMLAKAGEFEKAGELIAQAMSLNVESDTLLEETHAALAVFSAETDSENYQKAVDGLRKARAKLKDDPVYLIELGHAYRRLAVKKNEAGDPGGALATAREGLALCPKNKDLTALVKKIEKDQKKEK